MGSNELTTVEQVAAAILAGARFFSFHVPRANGTAGCRIAIELVYKWNTDANGHRYPSHVHGYSATYFSRHGYKEIGYGKSCGGDGHRYDTPAAAAAAVAPVILAAAVRAKGRLTVRRN
jgi:hypothetical protein